MGKRIETWRFRQLQGLPLAAKVQAAKLRIRQWHNHYNGDVYVSFSGGKDSTVLLHLVRSMYPSVPAVFADTGLEYPEIRRFVRTVPNVVWVKPRMRFKEVISTYGYPIVSKDQAGYIREIKAARRNGSMGWERQRLHGITRKGGSTHYCLSQRWHYLLDAPFEISDKCCDVMKKRPLSKYAKKSGRKPIMGTMGGESSLRLNSLLRHGCNAFDLKDPISRPLAHWCDEDVWQYIRQEGLPYASVYDTGVARTGCIFCGFGAHLEKEPNRFQRLQQSHPKLWRYCMDKLGLREVLGYIGVPVEV